MEIKYQVIYLDDVVHKDIPALPTKIKALIKRAIEKRLMTDPISFGKPLRYSLKGHRRLRVNNYRIVYRIDIIKNIVTILAIKHRKDIYEDS